MPSYQRRSGARPRVRARTRADALFAGVVFVALLAAGSPKPGVRMGLAAPGAPRSEVATVTSDDPFPRIPPLPAPPDPQRDAFALDLVATGQVAPVRAERLADWAVRYARAHHLPPALVLGVLLVENEALDSRAVSSREPGASCRSIRSGARSSARATASTSRPTRRIWPWAPTSWPTCSRGHAPSPTWSADSCATTAAGRALLPERVKSRRTRGAGAMCAVPRAGAAARGRAGRALSDAIVRAVRRPALAAGERRAAADHAFGRLTAPPFAAPYRAGVCPARRPAVPADGARRLPEPTALPARRHVPTAGGAAA
jgi:hypothetical protein